MKAKYRKYDCAEDACLPLIEQLGTKWDSCIKTQDGTVVAKLEAFAPEAARQLDASSPLIEILCAWRNEHANCFLDSNKVTPQSTLHWLLGLTISSDRLLFLIYSNDGHPIAQYGLRRLNADVVELDNGILGVRCSYSDMFMRIQLRILDICRSQLGFSKVKARVIANNIPALFLHKRCGLEKIELLENQMNDAGKVVVMGMSL